MKKIGTIESNYGVYMTGKKRIVIKFETENHTIAIGNVKWFDENSDETLNFVADLIIDDVVVGKCSNSGRGGCACYNTFDNNYDLIREVSNEVSSIQCYCFPSMNENFSDVLDVLACRNVSFIENKVKTIKHAKELIGLIQKNSDKYRELYSH